MKNSSKYGGSALLKRFPLRFHEKNYKITKLIKKFVKSQRVLLCSTLCHGYFTKKNSNLTVELFHSFSSFLPDFDRHLAWQVSKIRIFFSFTNDFRIVGDKKLDKNFLLLDTFNTGVRPGQVEASHRVSTNFQKVSGNVWLTLYQHL